MNPIMTGLSPATVAIFRTIGPNTATAAPFDIVLVTKVVKTETAAQSLNPVSAPNGVKVERKFAATHSAAPVFFISMPREIAAP